MSMDSSKKLSFPEMEAKLAADAHNSHMSNLAHARRNAVQQKLAAEKLIGDIDEAANKLDHGEHVDDSVIRALYMSARQ